MALPTLPALDDGYEAACSFTSFGNWLVPGRLMLGRYPFVEPSRCKSREAGEEQLQELLDAGITTFVCLQAELPSQIELWEQGKNGFQPYSAAARLLAASQPSPPAQELDFAHFPIVDLGLPDPDRLPMLLAELQARLEEGQNMYVHCWGGRGRAGTVGATLLRQAYGLDAEEALQRVQRAFSTRRDTTPRSPETDEQIAFVRAF